MFICFEGVAGSGKTTQTQLLSEFLQIYSRHKYCDISKIMKVNIFRIKEGKETILKKWGHEITEDMDEAVASIKEENVQSERMDLFKVGKDLFIVGVMVPEKGKQIKQHNPDREINKKHFQILEEAFGEAVKLENIYSVEV